MVALRYGWVAGLETHTLITSYLILPYLKLFTRQLFILPYKTPHWLPVGY